MCAPNLAARIMQHFLVPNFAAVAVLICLTSLNSAPVFTEAAGIIGVNYGTVADNLPTPAAVTSLILSTSLRNVKLYDTDAATLQAFANTGIKVVVGAGNDVIPTLAASADEAQTWVQANVATYMPATQIVSIGIGNEVLTTGGAALTAQLVPALTNVHTALTNLNLSSSVTVSTPHSLGILNNSFPPSSGTFQGQYNETLTALLTFLSETASSMMVNPYPYFAYTANPNNISINYALFENNTGVTDNVTNLHYSNLLDAQLDAVYSAMANLGFNNVSLSVSETGWPSLGDPTEIGVSVVNAQLYNGNLIKHITSNVGTPLRPNVSIDAYIFALFNEDLKPGPTSERNFGLFNANETAVYNVGLTAASPVGSPSSPPSTTDPPLPSPSIIVTPTPAPVVGSPPPLASGPPPSTGPATSAPAPPTSSVAPGTPSPPSTGKTWCVAKAGSTDQDLTNALNYVCGVSAADCSAIQPGASCYEPDTIISHATWAFNQYYRESGNNYWDCYFGGTAVVTISDPSYAGCTFA